MGISVNIRKTYGDFTLDVHFESEKKRIGILGASGCGKSMTLKSIAGIEHPDTGRIQVNGRDLFWKEKKINVKTRDRKVGYLFQNYALFSTMTVRENIACGVRLHGKSREERVNFMIRRFHLRGLEERFPSELSGGQQQRTALARIMAYGPDVILLDEPYSALDMFLKDRLQQEMQEMLEEYPGTVILVSHSRDEIYRFSEELLIMSGGHIVCYGETKKIFENPVYKEAARLTGCKNIAAIERLDDHRIKIPHWGVAMTMSQPVPDDIKYVGIRAHDLEPVWGEPKQNCIKVQVKSQAEEPFEQKFFLRCPGDEENGFCWFLQREKVKIIQEKGMPDYLEVPERKVLLLK